MNFSRVLFSISILLTFPIECFVSREVNMKRQWKQYHYYSFIAFISKQIVKNQIHRYQATGPVECEKELDPTLEIGTESDEHSTTITLAIVLTAFIISPMTECLGPVLELNVSNFSATTTKTKSIKIWIRLISVGTFGCHSTRIYFARLGLHTNGTAFIVQSGKITGRRFSSVWYDRYIGRCSCLVAQLRRRLSLEFRIGLLQKLWRCPNDECFNSSDKDFKNHNVNSIR